RFKLCGPARDDVLHGVGESAIDRELMNANSSTRRGEFLSSRGAADCEEHAVDRGQDERPAKNGYKETQTGRLHGRHSELTGDRRSSAGCSGEPFARTLRIHTDLRAESMNFCGR